MKRGYPDGAPDMPLLRGKREWGPLVKLHLKNTGNTESYNLGMDTALHIPVYLLVSKGPPRPADSPLETPHP